MTMTIERPVAAPVLRRTSGTRLVGAGPRLWRVVAGALVIGHLRAVPHPGGLRYRAERFHSGARTFRALGEFWSADDAVDCLRFAR